MIRRIYIHNFRCLENFELNLACMNSALLVGRNGTGKTAISFALEVLQKIGRGTNRVGQLVQPADFAHGRSEVPIRIEIDATLKEREYRYQLALELPEGFKELRVAEERLLVDEVPIYTRDRAQVILSSLPEKEARFLVDWHLISLPIIQERSSSDPLHIFKRWLSRMLILAPIPSQIDGNSNEETLYPDRNLANFSDWLAGILKEWPSAYEPIGKYVRDIMPDIYDLQNPLISDGHHSLSVQFRKEKASLSLPFGALSDGEKCFIICGAVLAASQAYQPFCFWDEPDNYLSISEVSHFLMALRRSFQQGGQFVATSHNSEAIRQFSDENTFVLFRRSHLEPTIIRPLRELNIHGDLIDAMIRDDIENTNI